jgi:dihydrofolate reductase
MTLRIEGFAIISDDSMLADATGAMPPTLVIEADQRFLSDGLDRASILVHGRNSHENQARSPQRRRLIATRTIESIAPTPDQPKALLWNPAGLSLEKAAEVLGVRHGTVAILGGTEIFGLFLPHYDVFHLSRVAGLHLSGGRPIFPQVPQCSAEEVLASRKLTQAAQQPLDVARGVTLTTWFRQSGQVAA